MYRQAAANGHTNAQYVLGWLYASGEIVEKNTEEAIEWLRQAASQNHRLAEEALEQLEAV